MKACVYDMIKTILGEIEPVGEICEDDKRFGNLKETCDLVESLVADIKVVSVIGGGEAENFANKFLNEIKVEI